MTSERVARRAGRAGADRHAARRHQPQQLPAGQRPGRRRQPGRRRRPTWPARSPTTSASPSPAALPAPGQLADDAGSGVWDVGHIGAEPARAESIAFTAAYARSRRPTRPRGLAAALGRGGRPPGGAIASVARSAYGLWLDRSIRHAEVVNATSLDGSLDLFVSEGFDALAGLRPRLLPTPNACPAPGCSTAVHRRAAGHGHPRRPGRGRASPTSGTSSRTPRLGGLVASFIERHQIRGLSVAPPG